MEAKDCVVAGGAWCSSDSMCEKAELTWPSPLPLVGASADGYGEGAKTGSACFGGPRVGPHFTLRRCSRDQVGWQQKHRSTVVSRTRALDRSEDP